MSTSFNMFLGSQLFDTTSTEKSRRSELAVGWKVHSFILLLHAARQLAVGNRGICRMSLVTPLSPSGWKRQSIGAELVSSPQTSICGCNQQNYFPES
jgi:hypothetical protein